MAKRTPTPGPTPKKGWQQRFINALASCGNVSRSAIRAKVHRTTAYEERDKNAEFAAAWDDALAIALDLMEGEAHRRAVEGTLKPVFHQGEKCGAIREYSDTLMIFLLKAHRPEKYRENSRMVVSGDPVRRPLRVLTGGGSGHRSEGGSDGGMATRHSPRLGDPRLTVGAGTATDRPKACV